MKVDHEVVFELIDKRIKILSKYLKKEIKIVRKNPASSWYVANDLKSKIYELVYLRTQIESVLSETKKGSQSSNKVEVEK